MADSKISALPASTTPLAGTEVLPIVQSGATKKVSVANLTAGRAISATEATLTTGNLVIGTSGKGVDFSAVVHSGSTSKLLADYEVGSWTPADNSGAGLTFTVANGRYIKVGNMVTCWGEVGFPATANASAVNISGLPFTVPNAALYRTGGGGKNNAGQALYPQCNVGTATIGFIVMSTGGGVTNVQMTGSTIYFTATYPSSLI